MYVVNNGEIYFSKELTEEQKKAVLDLFHPSSNQVSFSNGRMQFEEYYGADLTNDLNSILAYCEEWGVAVSDKSCVSYFGDYDGCYVMRDGCFVDLDQQEVGVFNASDFELRSELARRERKLFIPVDGTPGTPGYFISISREEAEGAYRYIEHKRHFDDALKTVKECCKSDPEFRKAFEDLCVRLHGHKHPADNILLRRSPVVEQCVILFEKYRDAEVPAAETWRVAAAEALDLIEKGGNG